jgi:hypothetical protein
MCKKQTDKLSRGRLCRVCHTRLYVHKKWGRKSKPAVVATEPEACLHCGGPAKRSDGYRGLCRRCHGSQEIRNQYQDGRGTPEFRAKASEARAKTTSLSNRLDNPTPTKQPTPTRALPGTAAKVDILAARVEAGEMLFHRHDATMGGE